MFYIGGTLKKMHTPYILKPIKNKPSKPNQHHNQAKPPHKQHQLKVESKPHTIVNWHKNYFDNLKSSDNIL